MVLGVPISATLCRRAVLMLWHAFLFLRLWFFPLFFFLVGGWSPLLFLVSTILVLKKILNLRINCCILFTLSQILRCVGTPKESLVAHIEKGGPEAAAYLQIQQIIIGTSTGSRATIPLLIPAHQVAIPTTPSALLLSTGPLSLRWQIAVVY
jgi:hypothetical protein